MSNYIAVRTWYYKKQKYKSLLKHIMRKIEDDYNSEKTKSIFSQFSKNNFTNEFRKLSDCRKEYKEINKKRPRKDFNECFEHLLIFSREQFEKLENEALNDDDLKKLFDEYIKEYCKEIKQKYGFEPLLYAFHLDEGHIDQETGELKRNIHCHLTFYNYDFKNKVAPLKKIQKKVIDPETGKREVNPAFSDFQDIAGQVFGKLGFKRGKSKKITEKDHLKRDDYIYKKQNEKNKNIKLLENKEQNDRKALNKIEENIEKKLLDLETLEFEEDRKKQDLDKLERRYKKLSENFNILKEKITKYINSFKKWFSRDYKSKQEALNQYNKEVKTPENELKKSAELTDNQKAIKEYLDNQEKIKNEKVKNSGNGSPKNN